MKLDIEAADLRPIVEVVVAEVVAKIAPLRSVPSDQIGIAESRAAELIDVDRHVLRDLRLAGEIKAARIGRRVIYRREDLLALLARRVANANR